MRARTIASLVLAASIPLSCDAVLGFQPGHLPADGGLAGDGGSRDVTGLPEAAGDAGHDDAPTAWTPANLGKSLVLWLDGDVKVTTHPCATGTGQCVTRWGDRSGNTNDGMPWEPQAEPQLVANVYNGHAAVRFDGVGTQLTIADSASLRFDQSRYTIAVVLAERQTSIDGAIFGKTALDYPYAGPGLWASYWNQVAGASPADGRIGTQVDYAQTLLSRRGHLDDGALRLVEADCDGTTLTLRVGDDPPVSRPVDAGAGTLSAIGRDAYVGGQAANPPSDSQPFHGDMTEVLVANDVLSATDIASLSAYLTTRYALGGDAGGPSDAGGSDGPAGDAPSWTPASLGSALAVWLRGDKGITTTPCTTGTCVTVWADQSGHHNDATSAAAGGTPPLYTTDRYGNPSVAYDGGTTGTASLAIADSASIEFAGAYTIIAVALQTSENVPGHVGAIYGKTSMAGPFGGPYLAIDYDNGGAVPADGRAGAQIDFNNVVASAESSLDGTLHVFSTVYDANGHLSVRVDDAAPTTVSATPSGPLTAVGQPAYIGGRPGSSQVVRGTIAEVIAVNSAISPADWSNAYAYLKSRYSALP